MIPNIHTIGIFIPNSGSTHWKAGVYAVAAQSKVEIENWRRFIIKPANSKAAISHQFYIAYERDFDRGVYRIFPELGVWVPLQGPLLELMK